MDEKVRRALLAKRRRNKKEIKEMKAFLKTVPEDIKEFRIRIAKTESDFIPSILGDVQDGYSPIILVCGRQRKGKTRFGVTLANIFSVFLYYERFNAKDFHLYPKELLKEITDEGYQVKVLDEAGSSGSGLNKHEWYSELAELFDYVLQTQGNLNNIYIFILPFASDLTTDIRKYVDYLAAAKKRGLFKIYKIYKREDQLVKNLKDFRQVFIEMLEFKKTDLPESLWRKVEKMCNDLKAATRKDKIERLTKKGDWLKG
jgi:hypothetical protein